jgi:hypothetical protein
VDSREQTGENMRVWVVKDPDPTFECILLRGGPTSAEHLRAQQGIRYTIITERSNVDHEHGKVAV